MLTKSRPRARNVVAGRTAKAKASAPRRKLAVRPAQVCVGVLVAWDDKGPLVDYDGNVRGPVRARVSGGATRVRAIRPGSTQEVVLLVDERPNRLPVLLGLLQPLDGNAAGVEQVEARVDGRRVELEGRDEVVLRCGEATITLRRNGRILIRGVQVETRAAGVNRIRGGSVAIN